jgi:hypothetical protein
MGNRRVRLLVLGALLAGVVVAGAYAYVAVQSTMGALTVAGHQLGQAQQELAGAATAAAPTPAALASGVPSPIPVQRTGGPVAPTPGPVADAGRGPASLVQVRAACEHAQAAAELLDVANGNGTGLALRAAGLLPLIDQRAHTASELLAASQEAGEGISGLCAGVSPLLDILAGRDPGASAATGALVVDALRQGRPQLEAARTNLASARERAEGLDPFQVHALGGDAERAMLALRQQVPALEQASETLLVLPSLFGADGARTYLVLSQNSDELRPTGGLIGTLGVLRIERGEMGELSYASSTDYDLPSDLAVPAPAPLATYLQSDSMQLHDANWWPDFPSSVAQVEYLWKLGGREQPDGVVALDQRAVELLLEALGPVSVPEYGEQIDAANMRQRLDAYVHGGQGYQSEDERKRFVGALSRAVLEAVARVPGDKLMGVGRALPSALDQKHMLLAVHDERAARLLGQAGWDGALSAVPGADYLQVVHANMTPNKHDRDIRRSLEYSVAVDDQGAMGRLRLSLENRMEPHPERGPAEALYRDYVRIYVPAGAILESTSGFADTPTAGSECGLSMFAGVVELPAKQSTTVELTYRLPQPVASALATGQYGLAIQKQPGTDADPVAVTVGAAVPLQQALRGDRWLVLRDGALTTGQRPGGDDAHVGRPACEIATGPALP